MKKALAVLLGIMMCLPMSYAAEEKITLGFNSSVMLGTVLDVLSAKGNRKFITDAQLSRKEVIINLKNVTIDEALDALLDIYDLYYVKQPSTDIYIIKSKAEGTVTTVSQTFFLNYASAKDLVAVLTPKLTRGGTMSADERTNCLIVNDMSDNIDKIGALLKMVDIPTMQVLLEAKIVDVKTDTAMKWGIDISNLYRMGTFVQNPLEFERRKILSGLGQNYDLLPAAITPDGTYQQTFTPGLSASAKFKFNIIQDGYNVDALIEAMKMNGGANVLSNPKLLVLNNEEATIHIVDEVPYEEKTQTEDGKTMVSTQFKEIGIKLRVKPQINRDGTIVLNVTPEQSFRTGESLGNVPIINTSKVATTFMLKNRETAVIGGLIRVTESKTQYKVPLLGDIPYIGYLFQKYSKETGRTELTIFITANIVEQ
ncbi:MAG: secretin N-terminal domain-containing protein [Elusimicrobiota bacterium]